MRRAEEEREETHGEEEIVGEGGQDLTLDRHGEGEVREQLNEGRRGGGELESGLELAGTRKGLQGFQKEGDQLLRRRRVVQGVG